MVRNQPLRSSASASASSSSSKRWHLFRLILYLWFAFGAIENTISKRSDDKEQHHHQAITSFSSSSSSSSPTRPLSALNWIGLDASIRVDMPMSPFETRERRHLRRRATENARRRSAPLLEASTRSLFRLNKVGKCCEQSGAKQQCKHACNTELTKLIAAETRCADLRESQDECGDEMKQEIDRQKAQFVQAIEMVCGAPLTKPDNDQLWECLLVSKYLNTAENSEISTDKDNKYDDKLANKKQQRIASEIAATNENGNTNDRYNNGENNDWDASGSPLTPPRRTHDIGPNLGMNPAKWMCCERARSDICKYHCYRTFGNEWNESWQNFEQFCRNSTQEPGLRECMDDADAACEYGCKEELKFCHYFDNNNNNHNDDDARKRQNDGNYFFRNCNAQADEAARRTYHSWLRQDTLRHSFRFEIHFQNLTNCQPDMWRILACALHLRPCVPDRPIGHSTEICRQNCVRLVQECVDFSKTSRDLDAAMLCAAITNRLGDFVPRSSSSSSSSATSASSSSSAWSSIGTDTEMSDTNCIDIDQYRPQMSNDNHQHHDMQHQQQQQQQKQRNQANRKSQNEIAKNVCHANKCADENRICVRNQDCSWNDCPRYRCVNTCTIGKLKELKVPQETFVTIPVMDDDDNDKGEGADDHVIGTRLNRCHNLCYCGKAGRLIDCHFYCMLPIAISGDARQTKTNAVIDVEESAIQKINCMSDCSVEFNPICDLYTSETHYNPCMQECTIRARRSRTGESNRIGLTAASNCGALTVQRKEIKFLCIEPIDRKCIQDQGTQLFPLGGDFDMHSQRHQFHVVLRKVDPTGRSYGTATATRHDTDRILAQSSEMICDTHGNSHINLTSFMANAMLRKSNVSFSYFGKCQMYCSLYGPVCGRDGRDYWSECAAHHAHVLVDYFAACETRRTAKCVADLQSCPSGEFFHYLPLNRCPFCGSVAYFHYDSNYFRTISSHLDEYAVKRSLLRHGQLNMQTLARQLRRLITIDRCELFAHTLAEGLIVATMRPSHSADPEIRSRLHRICAQELRRIVKLVRHKSPIVRIPFPLSLLRYNETIASRLATFQIAHKSSASTANLTPFTATISVILSVIIGNRIVV